MWNRDGACGMRPEWVFIYDATYRSVGDALHLHFIGVFTTPAGRTRTAIVSVTEPPKPYVWGYFAPTHTRLTHRQREHGDHRRGVMNCVFNGLKRLTAHAVMKRQAVVLEAAADEEAKEVWQKGVKIEVGRAQTVTDTTKLNHAYRTPPMRRALRSHGAYVHNGARLYTKQPGHITTVERVLKTYNDASVMHYREPAGEDDCGARLRRTQCGCPSHCRHCMADPGGGLPPVKFTTVMHYDVRWDERTLIGHAHHRLVATLRRFVVRKRWLQTKTPWTLNSPPSTHAGCMICASDGQLCEEHREQEALAGAHILIGVPWKGIMLGNKMEYTSRVALDTWQASPCGWFRVRRASYDKEHPDFSAAVYITLQSMRDLVSFEQMPKELRPSLPDMPIFNVAGYDIETAATMTYLHRPSCMVASSKVEQVYPAGLPQPAPTCECNETPVEHFGAIGDDPVLCIGLVLQHGDTMLSISFWVHPLATSVVVTPQPPHRTHPHSFVSVACPTELSMIELYALTVQAAGTNITVGHNSRAFDAPIIVRRDVKLRLASGDARTERGVYEEEHCPHGVVPWMCNHPAYVNGKAVPGCNSLCPCNEKSIEGPTVRTRIYECERCRPPASECGFSVRAPFHMGGPTKRGNIRMYLKHTIQAGGLTVTEASYPVFGLVQCDTCTYARENDGSLQSYTLDAVAVKIGMATKLQVPYDKLNQHALMSWTKSPDKGHENPMLPYCIYDVIICLGVFNHYGIATVFVSQARMVKMTVPHAADRKNMVKAQSNIAAFNAGMAQTAQEGGGGIPYPVVPVSIKHKVPYGGGFVFHPKKGPLHMQTEPTPYQRRLMYPPGEYYTNPVPGNKRRRSSPDGGDDMDETGSGFIPEPTPTWAATRIQGLVRLALLRVMSIFVAVGILDFEKLYPSLMMDLNLSPENLITSFDMLRDLVFSGIGVQYIRPFTKDEMRRGIGRVELPPTTRASWDHDYSLWWSMWNTKNTYFFIDAIPGDANYGIICYMQIDYAAQRKFYKSEVKRYTALAASHPDKAAEYTRLATIADINQLSSKIGANGTYGVLGSGMMDGGCQTAASTTMSGANSTKTAALYCHADASHFTRFAGRTIATIYYVPVDERDQEFGLVYGAYPLLCTWVHSHPHTQAIPTLS